MGMETKRIGLSLVLGVFAAVAPVHAGPTYRFDDITHNSVVDAAIGEAQLFLEVLPDVDPAHVQFRFANLGPLACSVTAVYFDDGSLLGLATIVNSTGVQFHAPATPADLPGGASLTPPFETTSGFSADDAEHCNCRHAPAGHGFGEGSWSARPPNPAGAGGRGRILKSGG